MMSVDNKPNDLEHLCQVLESLEPSRVPGLSEVVVTRRRLEEALRPGTRLPPIYPPGWADEVPSASSAPASS